MHNFLEQNLGELGRTQSVERARELVDVGAAVAVEVAGAVVDALGEILNSHLLLLHLAMMMMMRLKLVLRLRLGVLRVLTHFLIFNSTLSLLFRPLTHLTDVHGFFISELRWRERRAGHTVPLLTLLTLDQRVSISHFRALLTIVVVLL